MIKIILNSKYYDICNGVLYHWFQRRVKCNQLPDDKWIQQFALPRTLQAEAMKAYHDNSAGGAHLGIKSHRSYDVKVSLAADASGDIRLYSFL